MNPNDIVIEPVLTEKTNLLREEKRKKYVFKVHSSANKFQVMDAINKLFSVKTLACRIVTVKGKRKAIKSPVRFKRGFGFKPTWKKAIVTITEGQKIDIFEGA